MLNNNIEQYQNRNESPINFKGIFTFTIWNLEFSIYAVTKIIRKTTYKWHSKDSLNVIPLRKLAVKDLPHIFLQSTPG